MTQLQDRIAQFRKMANDDPENELGHYRLGQLLLEDKQYDEAIRSFRRTLELSPQFSKVYQLLGECFTRLGQTDKAVEVLTRGWQTADERGLSRRSCKTRSMQPLTSGPRSQKSPRKTIVQSGHSGRRSRRVRSLRRKSVLPCRSGMATTG